MITVHYINFLLALFAASTVDTIGAKMLCGFMSIVCLIGFIWEVLNETHKDSCL